MKLAYIVYGHNANKDTEDEANKLLMLLPMRWQKGLLGYMKDPNLATTILLDVRIRRYPGIMAINILKKLVKIESILSAENQVLVDSTRARYEAPMGDGHLTKRYALPYAQVSRTGPAIGPGAVPTQPAYIGYEPPAHFEPTYADAWRVQPPLDPKSRAPRY